MLHTHSESFKSKYGSLDNAENKLGLSDDYYLGTDFAKTNTGKQLPKTSLSTVSTKDEIIMEIKRSFSILNEEDKLQCFNEVVQLPFLAKLLFKIYKETDVNNKPLLQEFDCLLDKLYFEASLKEGITSKVRHFPTTSIKAMKRCQDAGKVNLLYKFSQLLINQNHFDDSTFLVKLNRMPFGLMDYAIQFFTCTDVRQIMLCYKTV